MVSFSTGFLRDLRASNESSFFEGEWVVRSKRLHACDHNSESTRHALIEMITFLEEFLEASLVLSCRRNPLDPFLQRLRICCDGNP